MAANSRGHKQPTARAGNAGRSWLLLWTVGAVVVLSAAFGLGRLLGSTTPSEANGQPTVQESVAATNLGALGNTGEKHEPNDLAAAEGGRLGQPALVWFGASW